MEKPKNNKEIIQFVIDRRAAGMSYDEIQAELRQAFGTHEDDESNNASPEEPNSPPEGN